MAVDQKKTKDVKIWMSEDLELELRRLADREERKFSDYVGLVLKRHVWGHVPAHGGDGEGSMRDE